MWITLVPLLLLCSITKIKNLVPWLTFALVLHIVGILIILGYLIQFTVTEENAGDKLFGDLNDIPIFIGNVLYAFEGAAMVLPLWNRMSTGGMNVLHKYLREFSKNNFNSRYGGMFRSHQCGHVNSLYILLPGRLLWISSLWR